MFQFTCCEKLTIKNCFCNVCKKDKDKNREQIIYTDAAKQIVILSTPAIDFPDLVMFDDIEQTDVIVFVRDDEDFIRFTSVQGTQLHSILEANEIKIEGSIVNKRIEDVVPKHILNFLKPIYEQTLQGNHLQLTTMWLNQTQLVRTFPIVNHKKIVIGGMAITSPFNTAFNGDINRFALTATPPTGSGSGSGQASQKRELDQDKPPSQQMDCLSRERDGGQGRQELMQPNHSGILQRD